MHVLDIEKNPISNFISLLFIQTGFNSCSHNIGTLCVKFKWNNIYICCMMVRGIWKFIQPRKIKFYFFTKLIKYKMINPFLWFFSSHWQYMTLAMTLFCNLIKISQRLTFFYVFWKGVRLSWRYYVKCYKIKSWWQDEPMLSIQLNDKWNVRDD